MFHQLGKLSVGYVVGVHRLIVGIYESQRRRPLRSTKRLSATYGILLSLASISSGYMFCPLADRIMVLYRPLMNIVPSSLRVPMSPVCSQPSGSSTASVASGFL